MRESKVPEPFRLVTAEELERFPSDDRRYELVEGRLVAMTPVSYQHSRTVIRFGSMLEHFTRLHGLGDVHTELGVVLTSDPDTVLAADISFIRRDRVSAATPRGFWRGAADLAVEVLSPDDRPGEVRKKVTEYLRRGTPLVLVIDPEQRTVSRWTQAFTPVTLSDDDVLDLDEVIAGFRCDVRALFD